MRQRVGADLRERALEEQEAGLVDGARGAFAELLDRAVEDVERAFELG